MEVISELKNMTESYFDVKRFVTLLFDEMKVAAQLGLIFAILWKVDEMVTHTLAFLKHVVYSELCYPRSNCLRPLFWEADF